MSPIDAQAIEIVIINTDIKGFVKVFIILPATGIKIERTRIIVPVFFSATIARCSRKANISASPVCSLTFNSCCMLKSAFAEKKINPKSQGKRYMREKPYENQFVIYKTANIKFQIMRENKYSKDSTRMVIVFFFLFCSGSSRLNFTRQSIRIPKVLSKTVFVKTHMLTLEIHEGENRLSIMEKETP